MIACGRRRLGRDGYRNFLPHFNMPIESTFVKRFWKIATKIQSDFLVVLCRETRHGYTTTIHSANKKQRAGRNQGKRHQLDNESHKRLARSSRPSSDIVKVFFSSVFYHVVLPPTAHTTHHSFINYVLLFRRNVAENWCDMLLLQDKAPVHKSNIT